MGDSRRRHRAKESTKFSGTYSRHPGRQAGRAALLRELPLLLLLLYGTWTSKLTSILSTLRSFHCSSSSIAYYKSILILSPFFTPNHPDYTSTALESFTGFSAIFIIRRRPVPAFPDCAVVDLSFSQNYNGKSCATNSVVGTLSSKYREYYFYTLCSHTRGG